MRTVQSRLRKALKLLKQELERREGTMKRSQVNEKLRRLAQQEKEAIRPDERHRAMTAALAQNAYKAAAPRRNQNALSSPLCSGRVRYTGKQIWIWQILLLLLIVSAFEQTGDRGSPYGSLFPYVPVPEDPGASVRGRDPVGLELRSLL